MCVLVGYVGGTADIYTIFKESAASKMEFGKCREGRNGIGQSRTSPIAGTCREEQNGSRPASERFPDGAIDLFNQFSPLSTRITFDVFKTSFGQVC